MFATHHFHLFSSFRGFCLLMTQPLDDQHSSMMCLPQLISANHALHSSDFFFTTPQLTYLEVLIQDPGKRCSGRSKFMISSIILSCYSWFFDYLLWLFHVISCCSYSMFFVIIVVSFCWQTCSSQLRSWNSTEPRMIGKISCLKQAKNDKIGWLVVFLEHDWIIFPFSWG